MNAWFRRDGQLHIPPALWLLLLLPLLAVLPPVPIDETRYLSIAWEMRQTGSWVTLHLNGMPYFDKPPLLFWLLNASWSVLGMSLWSSRVLVMLCGVACVALCERVERRLAPDASGQAAWMLLGLIFLDLYTGVVMFDVLLCACVLMGFLAIVSYVQEGRRGALGLLFVASALGLLAKGPVMLLHLAAPLLAAPWWSAGAPRVSWRRVGVMMLVVLLGALPVLAWAWGAVHTLSAADAQNLLLRQTAGRMVKSFAHNRPVWWYLPLVPVLLLPWPLVLRWRRIGAAAGVWRTSRAARFGLCASVPAFVAFCFVSGKQPHYLLPLLPGVAVLLGAWVRSDATLLAIRRLWVLVAVVAGVLLWAMLGHEPLGRGVMQRSTELWLYVLSSVMLIVACAYLALSGRDIRIERRAGTVALLLALALLPLVRLQVLGSLDVRDIAQRVAQLHAQGVPMARTQGEPGLVTFLARLPEPLPEAADPAAWAQQHPDGVLLTYSGRGAAPAGTENVVKLANGWVGLLPARVVQANASALDRSPTPQGD